MFEHSGWRPQLSSGGGCEQRRSFKRHAEGYALVVAAYDIHIIYCRIVLGYRQIPHGGGWAWLGVGIR
jgi:hypothetical protein